MNVSLPTGFLSISSPSGAVTPPPSWQIGQQLNAVVIALTGPQSVSLQVGNHTLEASTTVALPLRSQLQLEVVQGGAQPVLRMLAAPAPRGDVLNAALRAAVPQQMPLREIFAALSAIASPTSPQPSSTPPTSALVTQLLTQLPSIGNVIDPAGLQRAMRDAGVLLERKLARGATAELDNDLKGNLLKLLATLDEQNVDDGTRRLVSAAVARIELHQLNTLAQPAPDSAFTVELPVRRDSNVDVVQLRMTREHDSDESSTEKMWTVWIDFDIEPVGPVQAKVTLREEKITAMLWVQRTQGVHLINSKLPELERAMSDAGLQVKQLQCLTGQPPANPFAVIPNRLLDVTA